MKKIKMIVLGILLLGYWQLCLGLDQGSGAESQADYLHMPAKEVKQLAEQGDAEAQYFLGLRYFNGSGVPQNYAESIRWWRLAAENGDGRSLYYLGKVYNMGRGVPRDDQAAISWWIKGAERGDILSINELGNAYYIGILVPADKVQAHKWWNISSALGPAPGSEIGTQRREEVEVKMTPAQIAEAQKLALQWMEEYQ